MFDHVHVINIYFCFQAKENVINMFVFLFEK